MGHKTDPKTNSKLLSANLSNQIIYFKTITMPEKWDEEEDSSTPPSSPPQAAVSTRRKFDDEEDDSDVLDSWDAAEDSEVEREKAKVAAERKAKADAEVAANKKSKAQRIAEKQAEKARRLAEESDEESSEEDEATRRERLRRTGQESDLKHAEDLFGNIGISNSRKATTAANAVVIDSKDPNSTVDLTALPLFDPKTKLQFEKLRDTLVPVISNNNKKAQYVIFLQEFTKQLAKDLPSDQIKKIASTLTALSNEKMKEEKNAEKGGKKSKAQKTKLHWSLVETFLLLPIRKPMTMISETMISCEAVQSLQYCIKYLFPNIPPPAARDQPRIGLKTQESPRTHRTRHPQTIRWTSVYIGYRGTLDGIQAWHDWGGSLHGG